VWGGWCHEFILLHASPTPYPPPVKGGGTYLEEFCNYLYYISNYFKRVFFAQTRVAHAINIYRTLVNKSEDRVTDRFRLIYLKSTGLEKSRFDESSLSLDREKIPEKMCSSTEDETRETFSSQAILKQAKEDLKHPDPKVRIFAVQYFEKADPSIAVPLLQEVLSDRDSGVRAQALTSLIKFRNPVVYPLLKKYLKDSDVRVRMAALKGIFQFRENIELNLLLQFLSDESPWVRRKMATLLGWSQMEGALPILTELSKDQDSKVRKAALFSLITLYPEESESRFIEAMADSDPDLRKWAKSALEKKVARPSKGRTAFLLNRD